MASLNPAGRRGPRRCSLDPRPRSEQGPPRPAARGSAQDADPALAEHEEHHHLHLQWPARLDEAQDRRATLLLPHRLPHRPHPRFPPPIRLHTHSCHDPLGIQQVILTRYQDEEHKKINEDLV